MFLNKVCHHTHRGYDSMRLDRIRTIFALAFLVAAVSVAAAPAFAQSPYDGLWNVTIVTKTGSCEPSARYPLTVADGKVSAAGADVSGSVGREGNVRVSISGAHANGQLSGNSGSGKWNGASGGIPCSGRWEASRQ
jgi:hypothetical protein